MDPPLSLAVKAGDLVFISGIPPVENGAVYAPGDVSAQTQFIFNRMDMLLKQFGMTLSNLVYVQVFLRSLDDYTAMNRAYASGIPTPYPARKVIVTPLPKERVLVEISATASIHQKHTP